MGRLLQTTDGEVLANLLRYYFKADWIYTLWTYPGEPIDLDRSEQPIAGEEV